MQLQNSPYQINVGEDNEFMKLQLKINQITQKYTTHDKIKTLLSEQDRIMTYQFETTMQKQRETKKKEDKQKISFDKRVQQLLLENNLDLSIHDNQLNGQISIAKTLYNKSKYEDSLCILKQLVIKEQDNSDVHFLMGLIYQKKLEFQKAEQCYLKCLHFEQFSDQVFLQLALVYLDLQNFSLSLELFQKYRQDDLQGMYSYSKSLFEKEKYHDSLKVINSCILLQQKKQFFVLRMEIYNKLNLTKDAQRDLQKIISLV